MMNLDKILEKAMQNSWLAEEEIVQLLRVTEPSQRKQLYAAARTVRNREFGDTVFLYGFVYFSTHCKNDCSFCYYRQSNSDCVRYRKTKEEIVEISAALAASGVDLIDLTMGEDPHFHNNFAGTQRLIEVVRQVKQKTNLPLMISPGLVTQETLRQLKQAGADWYACYQETHNRQLFAKLRVNQNYAERWNSKTAAKSIGMLVEEGLLVGVGDQAEDAANSFMAMRKLGAEQVRTMSFVPQKGTPLYHVKPQGNTRELNIIAVMRILFPDRLIPASLDVEGIEGLKERLDAGANVVTSIIPPASGLVGVSQSTRDIQEGYRTVEGIKPILTECGLTVSAPEEYRDWMNRKLGCGERGKALCE